MHLSALCALSTAVVAGSAGRSRTDPHEQLLDQQTAILAAIVREWMRLKFKNPATGTFGPGVEGAKGTVAEWADTLGALKGPLKNST